MWCQCVNMVEGYEQRQGIVNGVELRQNGETAPIAKAH